MPAKVWLKWLCIGGITVGGLAGGAVAIANYASKNSSDTTDAINPATHDLGTLADDCVLKATSLDEWKALYKLYANEYKHQKEAYDENKNWPPVDKDDEDAQKTNMAQEYFIMSFDRVLKAYSLTQMYLYWNELDSDQSEASLSKMNVEDLSSLALGALQLQFAIDRWSDAVKTMSNDPTIKDGIDDEYKQRIDILTDVFKKVYEPSEVKLIKAINDAALKIGADGIELAKELADMVKGNYIQFDDDFTYDMNSTGDTLIKILNIKPENYAQYQKNDALAIDPTEASKYIKIYDEKGKRQKDLEKQNLVDIKLGQWKAKPDDKTTVNGLKITLKEGLKSGYRIVFNIKGTSLIPKTDPNDKDGHKLNEWISIMIN